MINQQWLLWVNLRLLLILIHSDEWMDLFLHVIDQHIFVLYQCYFRLVDRLMPNFLLISLKLISMVFPERFAYHFDFSLFLNTFTHVYV